MESIIGKIFFIALSTLAVFFVTRSRSSVLAYGLIWFVISVFVAVFGDIWVAVAVMSTLVLTHLVIEKYFHYQVDGEDEYYAKGKMYYRGDGVEQNYTEANNWFLKAAKQGHAEAQYMLGRMYFHGQGVHENKTRSYEWYLKAAESGDFDAIYEVAEMNYQGEGVEQNYKEAFKWFLSSAEVGDEIAQYRLARMYQDGTGVEKNDSESFAWFQKSAEHGLKHAQYQLGWCYWNGIGVKADISAAEYWYTKAAEQGVFFAQFDLVHLYVQKNNPEKVYEWAKIAQENEHLKSDTERKVLDDAIRGAVARIYKHQIITDDESRSRDEKPQGSKIVH